MLRNTQTSEGQGPPTSTTRQRERNHNCPLKFEEPQNRRAAAHNSALMWSRRAKTASAAKTGLESRFNVNSPAATATRELANFKKSTGPGSLLMPPPIKIGRASCRERV